MSRHCSVLGCTSSEDELNSNSPLNSDWLKRMCMNDSEERAVEFSLNKPLCRIHSWLAEVPPAEVQIKEEPKSPPSSKQSVYVCQECGFWAQAVGRFHGHLVAQHPHTSGTAFRCSSCDFRSTDRPSVVSHIDIHHNRSSYLSAIKAEPEAHVVFPPLPDDQYAGRLRSLEGVTGASGRILPAKCRRLSEEDPPVKKRRRMEKTNGPARLLLLPPPFSSGAENRNRAGPAVLDRLDSPGRFYLRLLDSDETLCCSLWGLRPAGHLTDWSGSATDKFKLLVTGKNLFFQSYHRDEVGDVYQVRLYFEYIQPAGPLTFEEIKTGSVNDDLMEAGLALKVPPGGAPVTIQPDWKIFGWTWPTSLNLPPDVEVKAVWVADDGRLCVHHVQGPSHHLDAIERLLNWFYAGSRADEAELGHWDVGEPCIARYAEDGQWNRAVVVRPDDKTRLALVRFVDYGNVSSVKYADLRRKLFCFDYPAQVYVVRLDGYPGTTHPPKPEELDVLDNLLVDKMIRMRVKYPDGPDGIPVATSVQLVHNGQDLKAVLEGFRPPEVIPLALADKEEEEEVDDALPPFNFVHPPDVDEIGPFKRFVLPAKALLPIRIIRLLEGAMVIQPDRHSCPLDDPKVPSGWYAQADEFGRMDAELQQAAQYFPELGRYARKGLPCACFVPEEAWWYRGLVSSSPPEGKTVRVHLVDIDSTRSFHDGPHLKQLPVEYLSLARHSAKLDVAHLEGSQRLIRRLMDRSPSPAIYVQLQQTGGIVSDVFYRDDRGQLVPVLDV